MLRINKIVEIINECLHFYRVPFSLLRIIANYYYKKILGKNMEGTLGEWAHVLYKSAIQANGTVLKVKDDQWKMETQDGTTLLIRNYPSSDVKVLLQVWGVQEYRGAVKKLQELYSNDYPLKMIDAGANVGYTSIYFKKSFPNSFIVAIEPATTNFLCLQQNIAANSFSNIKLENCALWHRKALLKVEQTLEAGNEWAFTVKETNYGGIESVGIRELMVKMNWNTIDVLKMDIEGAERYFFIKDGDNKWLDDIKFIIIEVHPIQDLEQTVCSILNNKGFSYFNYGELKVGFKNLA
jgi:FkbM family methyltransferase